MSSRLNSRHTDTFLPPPVCITAAFSIPVRAISTGFPSAGDEGLTSGVGGELDRRIDGWDR